ncbi:MAG: hypothetical protein HY512_00565 [Candidatus Aenigmarchaeota archaeon]|nr:hypothetical protein [Candidatus Aenigmarchaeota archaeon]
MAGRIVEILEPFCFKDEVGIAFRKYLHGELTAVEYRDIKRGAISKEYRSLVGL